MVFSSVYRDDREFAAALRLLARGVIDVAALTTGIMPLRRWSEAFASLRDPERAVKIFLDPAAGAAEGGHDQEGGQAQWPARAGMTSSA